MYNIKEHDRDYCFWHITRVLVVYRFVPDYLHVMLPCAKKKTGSLGFVRPIAKTTFNDVNLQEIHALPWSTMWQNVHEKTEYRALDLGFNVWVGNSCLTSGIIECGDYFSDFYCCTSWFCWLSLLCLHRKQTKSITWWFLGSNEFC